MPSGIELIAAERIRQVEKEGWDAMHDDEHDGLSLAKAAACYVHNYVDRALIEPAYYCEATPTPNDWPWDPSDWKPKDPLRDLVRAGALIAAEIDRLQRF